MKHGAMKVFAMALCAALFALAGFGVALGQEKIGNLVFKAMDELHRTSQDLMGNLKKAVARRKAAVSDREAVKKQYKRAKRGTLDKKELHAALAYAEAKVLAAMEEEATLIRDSAKDALGILYRLLDSVSSEGAETGAGIAKALEEAMRPRLEAGKSLFRSMAQYGDKITDPVINSKLNAAYDTYRMLSDYLKHMGEGRHGKRASRLALRQKIMELIDRFNVLYAKTDMVKSMLANNAMRLKMITEVAATEAAFLALSASNEAVERFSADLVWPLMEALEGSDETLDVLMEGVHERPKGRGVGAGRVQKWRDPKF